MTRHRTAPAPLCALVFFATGAVLAPASTSGAQDVSCSGGCCGTSYNCGVPDPGMRSGCSGARIRNGATGDCLWPLRADAERSIYDGLGIRIGEVRSDSVKLNQGIRKHFGGRWLVYAFSTTIRAVDGTLRPASGWIEQADLVHADRLHGYTLALDDPGRGEYEAHWILTGGDPARYAERYLHAPDGTRYPATDYLVRPYGLTHLTYSVPGFNLGGHATDSFLPGVTFRRSRGVPQIEVPLYTPRGYRSSLSLHFAYGYIEDGESRRFGWIAKEALVIDADGDGQHEGVDCDDANPAIHPGAADPCGDGVDASCDGADACPPPTDADADGYEAGVDCDDANPAIHPDAADPCGDGIDADCDGVDECAIDAGAPIDDAGTPAAPDASATAGADGGASRGAVEGGCAASAPGATGGPWPVLVSLLGLFVRRRGR